MTTKSPYSQLVYLSLSQSLPVWEMQKMEFWALAQEVPWRRAWQPTPVFLPGVSHGQEETGRLLSIKLQRVRHDWAQTAIPWNSSFPPTAMVSYHCSEGRVFAVLSLWLKVLVPWEGRRLDGVEFGCGSPCPPLVSTTKKALCVSLSSYLWVPDERMLLLTLWLKVALHCYASQPLTI